MKLTRNEVSIIKKIPGIIGKQTVIAREGGRCTRSRGNKLADNVAKGNEGFTRNKQEFTDAMAV